MTKNIVLIHGWGGSKASLEPLAKELEALGFTCFVLEVPGHGSTPQMNKPWAMADFSHWLKSELEKLNLGDYILLGHSFGGKIILDFVTSNIGTPEALILVDVNGIKAKNSFKLFFWRALAKFKNIIEMLPFGAKFKLFIYKYIIRETDYVNAKGNLKESFKLFVNQNYNEEIKGIQIPTLVLWAKKDSATPLYMGQFLHQNIANSKLVVMDGTHGLPLKRPADVAAQINSYLNTK